jgi:septal ring factor EnvC (AmiA/AmiB activator)
MEPDVQHAFDELQRSVTSGFTTLGRKVDSLDRKVDSLDRRLGAMEREAGNTAALFGSLGDSLANLGEQVGRLDHRLGQLDEQMGRNNARLDRVTGLLMASKTEAMLRHAGLEQRLLALEEQLRMPANDPRGSDA